MLVRKTIDLQEVHINGYQTNFKLTMFMKTNNNKKLENYKKESNNSKWIEGINGRAKTFRRKRRHKSL